MASYPATVDAPRAAVPIPVSLLVVGAWAALVAVLVGFTGFHHPPLLMPDDAMRLAQMRDLVQGQSFFSTVQPRINVPFGLVMHWPHYVDAAQFLLERMLQPLVGAQAETWMLRLWPLLLALPALAALGRIGEGLDGRTGAALTLALALFCGTIWGQFTPGRIDHHNLQLALCLWVVALLLRDTRTGYIAAAVVGMFSCAIGLETLPYILTASLLVLIRIVLEHGRFDRPAQWFGAGTAAAGLLLFACAPVHERAHAVCDAYSLFYAPIAVLGGGGLFALCTLPQRWRLVGAAGLTVAVLLLALYLNPHCLAGPYGQLDPTLKRVWLSRIQEAQPAWFYADQEPVPFMAGYGYAAACLLATGVMALLDAERRRSFLILAAFSGMALAVATWQIRGAPFALAFALPGMAALLGLGLAKLRLKHMALLRATALATLGLFLASDTGFVVAGTQLARALGTPVNVNRAAYRACLEPWALGALRVLPRGNIVAFVDQGPAILDATEDGVLAGPYHRGAAAILQTREIFTGAPAVAHRLLIDRHINYVVVCRPYPDYRFYLHESPHGLLAEIAHRTPPPWLIPVALPEAPALRVYRVRG